MRLSFFQIVFLLVGIFWICDGLNRGFTYTPLLRQKPQEMVVSALQNLNGRRILPNYVAIGSVSNYESPIAIEIFQDQFRHLKPGAPVDVYLLESPKKRLWVNAEKLEESKPIMSVFGLSFSWHFIAGILFTAYASFLIWKEKRALAKIFNLLNKRSSPADSGGAPPIGPAK
jgi:hypothetical protein